MSNRYGDDRDRKGSSSHNSRQERTRSRSYSRSRSRSKSSSSASPDRDQYNSTKQRIESSSSRHARPDKNTSSKDSHSEHRRDNYRTFKAKGESSDDERLPPPPPPPPRITKVSMAIGKPGGIAKPVQMKLSAVKPTESTKKLSVASAFSNNDSDDEVEEMPAECRMRMRNIGRDTPTSSGPNSFGKTKQGFCDAKKIFEKNLREINYD